MFLDMDHIDICVGPLTHLFSPVMQSELKMQVSINHEETKDDHVFLSTMKESGLIIKSKRENVRMLFSYHFFIGYM